MTAPVPPPAPALVPRDLLGRWHILATTLPFWHGKQSPRVEYAERPDGVWTDTLRFDARPFWGGAPRERTLRGFDTPHPTQPGTFTWRGAGALFWITSTWSFVRVSRDEGWAVTWFSAASPPVTPAGMDVYARGPSMPPDTLRRILDDVRADEAFSGMEGWYVTGQRGVDLGAYGLPVAGGIP